MELQQKQAFTENECLSMRFPTLQSDTLASLVTVLCTNAIDCLNAALLKVPILNHASLNDARQHQQLETGC